MMNNLIECFQSQFNFKTKMESLLSENDALKIELMNKQMEFQ